MLKTRQENEEVLYGEEPIIKIASDDTQWLKNKASQNERQRVRLCAHRSIGDSVHEMIIIHTRDTYVRPHKHLGKSESFHIIEGIVDVILFDDTGSVIHVLKMGKYETGMIFYYRISEPIYHTLLIQSDILVFHETTAGPLNREDTIFADWSPDAADKEACKSYVLHLSKQAAHHTQSIDIDRTVQKT